MELLETENKAYRDELATYKNSERDLEVKFAIDWAGLDVFSMERMYPRKPGQFEQTIVGYHKAGGVKEWYLQCTREEHNMLVDDFNEYLKNKPKTESGKSGI